MKTQNMERYWVRDTFVGSVGESAEAAVGMKIVFVRGGEK